MRNVAVIDIETTGLCAGEDRIIEVAAVLVRDGVIVDTFSELMDPGYRIPPFITSLTGISDAMVRGKPRPESVMPRLRDFLGDRVCIAHNASFDRRFILAEMDLAGIPHDRPFLCTLLLARRLLTAAPDHKLGTLLRHLRIDPPAGMRAHRALADVLMTFALWTHLDGLLRRRLHRPVVEMEIVHAISRRPKALVETYLDSLALGTDRAAVSLG